VEKLYSTSHNNHRKIIYHILPRWGLENAVGGPEGEVC